MYFLRLNVNKVNLVGVYYSHEQYTKGKNNNTIYPEYRKN